ncbi:MAG: PQQ-binding-like beta-propeller repeat protein [Planctomycetaceae bacterium]|nr:PQQ-binding-like beta-propeller repeat protein [Planctomycetaceae bacterium]
MSVVRFLSICTLLSVGLLSLNVSAEENWPEFRGPNTNGQALQGNPPTSWSEGQNVVWKTPLPGRAWSSPVVWGSQIWMTNATEDGTELFGVCLDRNSGEVLYNEKLFDLAQPPEIHKFNSFSSPSPIIEEGRVYLSWGSYGLVCLDTNTMKQIWQRRDLECEHYRGPGSSPIIFQNLLIQHYDGYDYQYVIALDKNTGDTVWRTKRPKDFGTDNGDQKKAYATPIVIEVEGQLQLISPTSKGMFAYNPLDGSEIWRVTYDGFSTPCRPVYDPATGLVIISTGFSKGVIIAVNPTGKGDVTETHLVWEQKKSMPSKPSPLLIDGKIYVIQDQGVATCLDVKTGDPIWQQRIGGNYSASPVFAGGNIYASNEDGQTTVFRPGNKYEEVAVNQLEDGFMASPAIIGNAMILRTRSAVYRVENRN